MPDIRDKMTKLANKSKGQPYDFYIGRGSIFGNPFEIGRDGTREEVIERYREWFSHLVKSKFVKDQLKLMKDKTLGCFCAPQKCHGEVIIDWIEKNL